jgi:hypothetical protein
MAKRITYTDKQQEEFCELAQEIGVGRAMRELGFPRHYVTSYKWLEGRGIEITKDAIKQKAAVLRVFYDQRDKALVAQAVLDRLHEKLESDDTLTADELNKIANAVQRAVQTIALVEGDATDRRETVTKDGTDIELIEMLNEARAANDAYLQDQADV